MHCYTTLNKYDLTLHPTMTETHTCDNLQTLHVLLMNAVSSGYDPVIVQKSRSTQTLAVIIYQHLRQIIQSYSHSLSWCCDATYTSTVTCQGQWPLGQWIPPTICFWEFFWSGTFPHGYSTAEENKTPTRKGKFVKRNVECWLECFICLYYLGPDLLKAQTVFWH